MIASSFETGKRPSFADRFTSTGKQKIKEYNSILSYHVAIDDLNSALTPFVDTMRSHRAEHVPAILVNSDHHGENWRRGVSVTVLRDNKKGIEIRGETRFDRIDSSSSQDRLGGPVTRNDRHHIENIVATLSLGLHGEILGMSFGRVHEINYSVVTDLWTNEKYLAKPIPVTGREQQAATLYFLTKFIINANSGEDI